MNITIRVTDGDNEVNLEWVGNFEDAVQVARLLLQAAGPSEYHARSVR